MSDACVGASCLVGPLEAVKGASAPTGPPPVKPSPYGAILPPKTGGSGFYRDVAKNVTRLVDTDERADRPGGAELRTWVDRIREISAHAVQTDPGVSGLLEKLATDLEAWI